jgi:large-conductance mechanosensitive channel
MLKGFREFVLRGNVIDPAEDILLLREIRDLLCDRRPLGP